GDAAGLRQVDRQVDVAVPGVAAHGRDATGQEYVRVIVEHERSRTDGEPRAGRDLDAGPRARLDLHVADAELDGAAGGADPQPAGAQFEQYRVLLRIVEFGLGCHTEQIVVGARYDVRR